MITTARVATLLATIVRVACSVVAALIWVVAGSLLSKPILRLTPASKAKAQP
jgi:hypothetical protein